jgi:hypothetical protein
MFGGIMTNKDKIQQLLVTYLLKEGSIKLKLPDGITLEVGIVKEGKDGTLKLLDNYCWLIASQKDREISIDSYNLAMRYKDENDKVILEDNAENENGDKMRIFSIF